MTGEPREHSRAWTTRTETVCDSNSSMCHPSVAVAVRTIQLEVRRADGWETVVFEDVEQVRLAGAPGEEGLQFTLLGVRSGAPNRVETGVLDIADRHEGLVESDVPTLDGQALPVALRDGD